MRTTRVVVVGAGLGGLRVSEALRANGYAGEIVVIGDERYKPYNRPPLSKGALADRITHENLAFRRRADSDIVWRLRETVTSVDVDGRTVTLMTGETLSYAALVIATGVSARRLAVPVPPPTTGGGRYVVRTFDNATALRNALVPGAKVVVLGAGFIGSEVAATASTLGCRVTCVAIDTRPMIRPLGGDLATELQRRHEAHGVRFRLGVGVATLLGDRRVSGVVLSDGTRLDADLIVEALGSVCNTKILDGHGFDLSDGVLVDSALRPIIRRSNAELALDGVAVVGDVARFPNPRFGEDAWRIEHWSVPTDTARRAGEVLAAYVAASGYEEAVRQPWAPLPSFWSDQYDMRLQSYGMPNLADSGAIRLLEGDLLKECVVGYFRDGDLIGVVGIGMLRAVNAYRDRVGHRQVELSQA